MHHQIRTALKDEGTTSRPDKERGSRYWSAAEVMSSTWFVVETCVEKSGTNEIQRWVTTSIREAALIQRSQEPYQWAHIFVCLRAPLSVRSATIFEVVTEAYQLGSDASYLYQLENGLSFIENEGLEPGIHPDLRELKLLYAQRR